jgi:hypothetical protein
MPKPSLLWVNHHSGSGTVRTVSVTVQEGDQGILIISGASGTVISDYPVHAVGGSTAGVELVEQANASPLNSWGQWVKVSKAMGLAPGTYSVTSTISAAALHTLAVYRLQGVDLGSLAGAALLHQTGSGTAATLNVPVTADQGLLCVLVGHNTGVATPTANMTQRMHHLEGNSPRAVGDAAYTGTETIGWTLETANVRTAMFLPINSGTSSPVPGAPFLGGQVTSWDAVRLEAEATTNTDSIEVRRSTTSPVTESDTLVATVTPQGVAYDTSPAPATAYFYRAFAVNADGTTAGSEVALTTWSDQAIGTAVDGDPIVIPFEVPAGVQQLNVKPSLGKIVRAAAGEGRAVDFAVVVKDAGDVTVGSETFLNVGLVELGTEYTVPLSPAPSGPQTISVTITPTIAA